MVTIPKSSRRLMEVLRRAGKQFAEDRCPMMAAAIAYYGVFALPPLLVIVVAAAGKLFGRAAVEGRITEHAGQTLGDSAAGMIEDVIERAAISEGAGLASLLAGAALVFGATNAFAHLQVALNIVWDVETDRRLWKTLLRKRLLSFVMILVLVALMAVLLVAGALIAALESSVIGESMGHAAGVLFQAANFAVALTLLTLFFAAVFKFLPDAEVSWRRVTWGALGTALLFTIGMAALWLFLGFSRPGSAYGAAGSVAVVMLWMYLSGLILLFGAEITSVPPSGAAHTQSRAT